jgi:hypothetical protein
LLQQCMSEIFLKKYLKVPELIFFYDV